MPPAHGIGPAWEQTRLAKFIEAVGGTLEIRACFPEGSVRIKQFSEVRRNA